MTENIHTAISIERASNCELPEIGGGIFSTEGTATMHVFSLLGPEEEGGDRAGSWGGFGGHVGGAMSAVTNGGAGGIRKMTQQVELDEQNRLLPVPRKPRIRPTQRMIPGFDSASVSQSSQQNAFCLDTGANNIDNSSTASSQRLYSSLPINGTSTFSASSNAIAGVPFSLPMSSLFETRINQKQNPIGGATSISSAGSIRSNLSPQRKCATLVPLPFVIKEEVEQENKVKLNPTTVVIGEATKSSSSSSGTPLGSAEAVARHSIDQPFEMLRKISYDLVQSPTIAQTVKEKNLSNEIQNDFRKISLNVNIQQSPPMQHFNVQRNIRGKKGSSGTGNSKREAMFQLLEKSNQENQEIKTESKIKMEQLAPTMPTNVGSMASLNQFNPIEGQEYSQIVTLESVLQEIQLFDRHQISQGPEQNGAAICSDIASDSIQAFTSPQTMPIFTASPEQLPKTNFFDMLLKNLGGIQGQENRGHPKSWMAGDKYLNQSTLGEQNHMLPPVQFIRSTQPEFEHALFIKEKFPSKDECTHAQN